MTVAVFGGTGRTGRPLVSELRSAGISVRVLARRPEALSDWAQDGGITVVAGSAEDPEAVKAVLSGADAAVSVMGPVKGEPAERFSRAGEVIATGCAEAGVSRLLWMTGAGVMLPQDEPSFSRRMIRGIMKLVAGPVLAHSEAAVQSVINSGVDYTVIRAPMLSEDSGEVALASGYAAPKARPVPRAQIARWIVAELQSPQWRNHAPMLGLAD